MTRGIGFFACALLLATTLVRGAGAVASTRTDPGTTAVGKALAPEFGPSVVFDQNDPPVRLSDLHGKMVLVVFFQSWCPICNGWSPDFFKQVTTSLGDDPAVTLVALKVDGGGVAKAKEYLQSMHVNLSKWNVGSDTGGVYYQRVSGGQELYGYALIDQDGRLVERGKAGMYYTGGNPKKYVLGDPKIRQKVPAAAPILADGNTYPPELHMVVRVAELGNLRLALTGIRGWEHGKIKETASKLREELLTALSARVEAWSTALKGSDPAARYEAYRQLRMTSMMSDIAPGKAAKEALASIKSDKELTKELARQEHAETVFWGIIAQSQKLEIAERKDQLATALKQFAAAYEGTSFADRATAEAQTIGSGAVMH